MGQISPWQKLWDSIQELAEDGVELEEVVESVNNHYSYMNEELEDEVSMEDRIKLLVERIDELAQTVSYLNMRFPYYPQSPNPWTYWGPIGGISSTGSTITYGTNTSTNTFNCGNDEPDDDDLDTGTTANL